MQTGHREVGRLARLGADAVEDRARLADQSVIAGRRSHPQQGEAELVAVGAGLALDQAMVLERSEQPPGRRAVDVALGREPGCSLALGCRRCHAVEQGKCPVDGLDPARAAHRDIVARGAVSVAALAIAGRAR